MRSAVVLLALVGGCGGQSDKREDINNTMRADNDLHAIRNANIQFATYRPPEATLPTRGRRVKVIAPPEAKVIAERGDIADLDRLLPLLDDKERAWAAEVVLAAMTGYEADLVNDTRTAEDFETLRAGARQRWQTWLDEVRGKLVWDATRGYFVVK